MHGQLDKNPSWHPEFWKWSTLTKTVPHTHTSAAVIKDEFWSLFSICFILTTHMIHFSGNCHHISKHAFSALCNIQAVRLTSSAGSFLPAFAGKFSWESSVYDNISWPFTPQLIFRVQTRIHSPCTCRPWHWGVVCTVCEAVHIDSSRLAAPHAEGTCSHGVALKWNVSEVRL